LPSSQVRFATPPLINHAGSYGGAWADEEAKTKSSIYTPSAGAKSKKKLTGAALVWKEVWTSIWRVAWIVLLVYGYLTWYG